MPAIPGQPSETGLLRRCAAALDFLAREGITAGPASSCRASRSGRGSRSIWPRDARVAALDPRSAVYQRCRRAPSTITLRSRRDAGARPLRTRCRASARSRRRSWCCMASAIGSCRAAMATPCSMPRPEPKEGWFAAEGRPREAWRNLARLTRSSSSSSRAAQSSAADKAVRPILVAEIVAAACSSGRVRSGERRDGMVDTAKSDDGQKSRARLFGRARHLGHPALAAGDLSLRGRHLHRRSRPGRGARAGAPEGRAAGRQADLHRRSARGVRARFRLPDVPRQRALRGRLSARHLDRAAADRQAPDRDRRQRSAPTRSPTARPARATTRCASSSAITRWSPTSR